MKTIKGSATIEAAVALPVFICIIASLVFIIRIVQVHEILQRAVTESACELSVFSYACQAAGIKNLHDTIRDNLSDGASEIREQADLLEGSFDESNSLTDTAENVYSVLKEIIDDPEGEIKNILCLASENSFDDFKVKVFSPVLKLLIKNNLAGTDGKHSEEALLNAVIEKGLEGIDFQGSSFFRDADDIIIRISYRIRFPFPVRIFPVLNVRQQVSVKAWTDGDASGAVSDTSGNESIWSLDNFSRGKKLRDIFGGNLPYGFPVISKYEDGVATMMKSMDTTLEYYQDVNNICEEIDDYIKNLSEYKGQDEPWGKDEIVLPAGSIKTRELHMIIPENPLQPEIEAALNACRERASAKGVQMTLTRYLVK